MKKNNKKWFSLVLALWLVIFMTLITLNILDYIIPFSKETKDIENSVVAYYQANSWIENALYYLKTKDFKPGTENNSTLISNVIRNNYEITAVWNVLPPVWEWNSEFDENWNQIALWNAIQLEIWYWKVDFNKAEFAFKVPDFVGSTSDLILDWDGNSPVINWQISSPNNTLNSDWSYLKVNDIWNSNDEFSDIELEFWTRDWIDLLENNYKIEDFYTNNCIWTSSGCILKLSLLNNIKLVSGPNIPYLEWQIDFDQAVPLRYFTIKTTGNAYSYKKTLEIKIPQKTTNEAFDFTIFQ